MKKTLSFLLALVMVFSVCFILVSADEEEETGPAAYLWLTSDESYTPYIKFQLDGSKLTNREYKIRAEVYFSEDCTGAAAYVNYYSYSDATKENNFEYLISFKDFATYDSEDIVLGAWNSVSFEFNPYEAVYAAGNANTKVNISGGYADTVELLTIGVGFWQATGTIKIANILISEAVGGDVKWSKGFAAGLDLENDEEVLAYEMNAAREGTHWGVVTPPKAENGNIATEATLIAPVGYGAYTAVLNDGVALGQSAYTNDWFAFYNNNDVEGSNAWRTDVEGTEYFVGTAILDFGSVRSWEAVRANMWDGAGNAGISGPSLIMVSYSDDGEDWTEAGDLLLGEPGTIYWAEKEFDTIDSRFVRLQFCWVPGTGVFLFVNEIEVIEADQGIIEEPSDEPSEEPSSEPTQSEPGETSEPETPPTGDNGIVALAIISTIALAGAVMVKRRNG